MKDKSKIFDPKIPRQILGFIFPEFGINIFHLIFIINIF